MYEYGVIHHLGYAGAGSLVKTLGLLATPLVFAAIFLAVSAIGGWIAGEGAWSTARRYVLTLVPIAVAYHLAHYQSYLMIQGQMLWPLVSDPLNLGWNLFGGRGHIPDIATVDMRMIWLSSTIAIVLGHVIAVLLAHDVALAAPGRRARISQIALTTLMVAYTILSLWILSQPIVEVS
jgi:hypothetical protein